MFTTPLPFDLIARGPTIKSNELRAASTSSAAYERHTIDRISLVDDTPGPYPAEKKPNMSEDLIAIEKAAWTYLDGLHHGDADKLASVFHPTSALTYEKDGVLQILPRDQWLASVRTRESAAKRGLSRADHLLQVDVVGPRMALVKLKCAIPPLYFTDLLSFLKIDGNWQVVQKVFMSETRT